MPDWTYHPVWRPLMFRLPAEDARRLTIGYLELQGRTKIGRELFRLLSYGFPEADSAVEAFGLSFRSRFGFGPGLDMDGRGLRVSQYLGCGFLTVGPVSLEGRPRVRALDRIRIPEHHALAWSDDGYCPSARDVELILTRHTGMLELPVGISIDDSIPARVVAELADRGDFFTVVRRPDLDAAALNTLRSATPKPLLLRLPFELSDDAVLAASEDAVDRGFNGVVVGEAQPYEGLLHGRLAGRPIADRALDLTRAIRDRFGDDLPVVVTDAVRRPEDAAACLFAGASLVEITSGFVFSGPGIAGRSIIATQRRVADPTLSSESVAAESPLPDESALADGTAASSAAAAAKAPLVDAARASLATAGTRVGWWGLVPAAVAVALLLGPAGWLDALPSIPLLLRDDVADARPSYGAALVSSALLAWIVAVLARRGEAWVAWLAVLAAVLAFAASPLVGGLGLLVVILGEFSARWLSLGFRSVFDRGVPAWRWSATNLGRRTLQAGALVGAGAAILVDQPMILRVLAVAAFAIGAIVLERGLLPGVRALWLAILGWYTANVASVAVLIDGPLRWAVIALTVLLGAIGLSWLNRPLLHLDEGAARFPDI